ncbi:hypothetical protein ROA7450_03359 [Roseovarius albus]|uniref:Uncharacterized protein n=1 Tax=Roseovarius albus TaxID=1247867 RepID=A0A1X6ZX91_9RHOB|nr:hypothetical protein [Roseovarius albus]SLN63913.1 hypothetical protein ROA7450_03359 [Roseovarius albus]
MKRRGFLLGSAVAPTAIFAAQATTDPDKELDAILSIAKHTGLSIDDLVDWLEGVDVERIAQNVKKPPSIKWDQYNTHSSMQAVYAGTALSLKANTFPGRGYLIAQLRAKGDRQKMRQMMSIHTGPEADKIARELES